VTLSEFIQKAMRIPYVDKGRDYSGVDCYGLLYLCYKEVVGVTLASHLDDYPDAGETPESRAVLNSLIAVHRDDEWEHVSGGCKPLDVVLFTLGGQPLHLGIALDKKRFFHAERRIGVVVQKMNSSAWTKRKEGVYRLCQKK